ncbi:hypothetical protein [Geothrix sp. 21YS21S-4]|uniref:hypothetical protein n=1 Tax=Geothrix sp. 21YS21S-4 TaxID=3068889 RepID=UPI0027B9EBD0|nr:hypothetical protein [Geothrix sp. 21YS21S-4]
MINYLFLAEGTSDQVLIPIINSLIFETLRLSVNVVIPNFNSVRPRPTSLNSKLNVVNRLYKNIDFLVIHRDADAAGASSRLMEMEQATACSVPSIPWVPAIPVKMTEAWLLTDRAAIFKAIGCRRSDKKITFCPNKRIEGLADPKDYLFQKIYEIADLPYRRRKDLNVNLVRRRIGDFISDSPELRLLPSFRVFEGRLKKVLHDLYD